MFTQVSPSLLGDLLVAACLVLLLMLIVSASLWSRVRRLQHQYDSSLGTDLLTGQCNRMRFMELAERQINHVQRTGRCAAAMIIDLDECQKINERYGHQGGDLAVQLLARCAQSTIRDYDLLGRYSGEEMAMLLPDTSLEGADAVAQRLRETLASQEVLTDKGERFPVTVTIGISALSSEMDTLEDLLLAADSALNNAKTQGLGKTVSQRI